MIDLPSDAQAGSSQEPEHPASIAAQTRRIIVSVDIQHQQITEVRDGLTNCGVVVEQVLAEMGMITATVPDEAHVAAARQVAGVISVEHDRSYQLPPPDAPLH